jgi:hypothetical protein
VPLIPCPYVFVTFPQPRKTVSPENITLCQTQMIRTRAAITRLTSFARLRDNLLSCVNYDSFRPIHGNR